MPRRRKERKEMNVVLMVLGIVFILCIIGLNGLCIIGLFRVVGELQVKVRELEERVRNDAR